MGRLAPGTSVGPYRIAGELGRGGMGAVYEAVSATGERAAIKVLHDAGDARFLERFQREVRAAGKVDHRNVARVLGAGEFQGTPYIALELLTGGSLADRLRRKGPLGWREAAHVGAQIARGVAAIHAAGLVHRDLKPANVLLDGAGEVKVSDFGLARSVGRGSIQLTKTAELVGTLEFMAPEQAEGGGAVDARADLYALGGTLFALLVAEPPFVGSGLALVTKHLREQPRSVRSLVPDVPDAFDRLIQRLLAKAPQARGRIEDVVAELEALATPGRGSRRRLAAAVAVAGGVALLGGAGLVAWRTTAKESALGSPGPSGASPVPRPSPSPSPRRPPATLDGAEASSVSAFPGLELRGRIAWSTFLQEPTNVLGHTRASTCAAFVEGQLVVSGGLDGRVFLSHLPGRPINSDIRPGEAIRAVAVTTVDGQRLVLAVGETARRTGVLRLSPVDRAPARSGWHLADSDPETGTWLESPRPLACVAFATAGVAFVGGEEGLIRVDVPAFAAGKPVTPLTLRTVDAAAVTALARGPDGFAYAGYADGQVKVWDASSDAGAPVVTRGQARAPVRSLDCLHESSRDTLLVLDGGDGKTRGQAHLVSLDDSTRGDPGEPIDLGWPDAPAAVFGSSPDEVVAPDPRGRLVIWRRQGADWVPLPSLDESARRHHGRPLSLTTNGLVRPGERRYLTTAWDHSVRSWREEGRALASEASFDGIDRVTALAGVLGRGAGERYLGVAWEGPGMRVGRLRLDDGSQVEVRPCAEPTGALALSADGMLAAGQDDGRARLWRFAADEPGSGEPWRELLGGTGPFRLAAFLEASRRLVTASADGRLRLTDLGDGAGPAVDASSGDPRTPGVGLAAAVAGLEGPDGLRPGEAPRDLVVTASDAGTIGWWRAEAGAIARTGRVDRPGATALAIESLGRRAGRVAVGFADGLELVSQGSGVCPVHRRREHPGVEALAWHGGLVAACCDDATVRIYESERLDEVARVDLSQTTASSRARPTAVVFDPQPVGSAAGQILYVGTDRGAVLRFDVTPAR